MPQDSQDPLVERACSTTQPRSRSLGRLPLKDTPLAIFISHRCPLGITLVEKPSDHVVRLEHCPILGSIAPSGGPNRLQQELISAALGGLIKPRHMICPVLLDFAWQDMLIASTRTLDVYLSGPDTAALQLNSVGYQYPHTPHEWYDSDWLDREIRVIDRQGDWSSPDPIMLTWEVARLADWLDAIAGDRPARSRVSCVAPNLRFELTEYSSSQPMIGVCFEQGPRPPWDLSRFGFSGGDVASSELHPTADALRQAAADLRAQLQRFPIRVDR